MTKDRWAAATGLPLIIGWIVLMVLSGGGPSDTSKDHTILKWYASHSHRVKDIATFFVLAVASIFFVWFIAHLRTLLLRSEGEPGTLTTVATVAGSIFIALFAVAGAAFTATAIVANQAGHKFTLDPNTFRILQGIGELTFIGAFFVGSGLPFAVGVLAWRTRFLPRWLAVMSFVGGIGALASFIFFPAFLFLIWVLLLSLYLMMKPAVPAAAAVPA
jgi:hypothetical protein